MRHLPVPTPRQLGLLLTVGVLAAGCGDEGNGTRQATNSATEGMPEPEPMNADPSGNTDPAPGMNNADDEPEPGSDPDSEPGPSNETVDPDGTDPEPTDPDIAIPEPTDPEATDPDASEPEATDPDVAIPEPSDSMMVEPEPTEPEVSEPEPTNGEPDPGIVEPVTEEDYYIRNQTANELTLLATTVFGNEPVELIADTVPAEEEVHIYHAVEGSGGHAMPSNFFGDFQVLSGDAIVYQGVVNEDWLDEEYGLVLVIEADPTVSSTESVDYGCVEASDCTIKDVGNCCGYYPRCVNVDSPTPEPECGDGAVGVCGWPVISHCECVENTCRSMQGDTEI